MKKFFLFLILIPIFLLISYKLIASYNIYKLKPTEHEIAVMTQKFGDISIVSEEDLIRVQNKTFDLISAKIGPENPYRAFNIDTLFQRKRGLCFDRSILLQKIMIYNKIEVIPVFLFYDPKDSKRTSIINLFDKDLHSHNIFEIVLNKKRIAVETNLPLTKIENLQEYINNSNMPKGTKFLRHLNNRNGYFISPSWIPDIY